MINFFRLITALFLFTCTQPALAQSLKVHFVDVGQGDAVLIQSPSGQNVVYDGGEAVDRMVAYLQAAGVSRVDLVVASHNHADHIGGLAEVVRRYRPRFYLDNGIPATTLTYRRLLTSVEQAGSQLLEPTARRVSLGDATLQVVSPPGIAAWDQNSNSVGIVVEYGTFRLSLAGDAEPREWSWWNARYPQFLSPVHVHKASHHGSRTGDTAAAVASLSPEIVVISAGHNNRYGHPHADALLRYASERSIVYRTDLDGTVVVAAERSGRYNVRVARGEGAQPSSARRSEQPLLTPNVAARQTWRAR